MTSDDGAEALAVLPGVELGRVIGNALAFVPARSSVKTVALTLWGDRVEATGTDTYAAGTDYVVPGQNYGPRDGVQYLLTREDATELERLARMAKTKLVQLITFPHTPETGGPLVKLEIPEDEEPHVWAAVEDQRESNIYGILSDQLGAGSDLVVRIRDPRGPLCLDPSLFSRFGKVKADQTGRMADLFLSGEPGPDGGDIYGPVLVRIGPTFRGLIMPIERAVQAEAFGQDGLWDMEAAA